MEELHMKTLLKKAITTMKSVITKVQATKEELFLEFNKGLASAHNANLQDFMLQNYASQKVAQYATELNNVEIVFGHVNGLDLEMIAAYLPEHHAIALPYSADIMAELATAHGLKWEAYVDIVLAHEMGHAIDPTVEGYATLMNAQDTLEGQQQVFVEHALQLEINAEKYGLHFTKHKKAFTRFNQLNQVAYRGRLDAIREFMNGEA